MEKIENICKDVLDMLENSKTKIKVEEKIKSSYYFFMNDTIYLSKKQANKQKQDAKVVLICHECIHSVQDKWLQIVNFILSNVELLMFLIVILVKYVFRDNNPIVYYGYIGTALVSIIIRYYLEIGAVIGSVKLANKYYIKKGMSKDNIKSIIKNIKKKIIMSFPVFLTMLFGWKIIRIIIALC